MNGREARKHLIRLCDAYEGVVVTSFSVYDDVKEQLVVRPRFINEPCVVPVCLRLMHHAHMGVVIKLEKDQVYSFSVPKHVVDVLLPNERVVYLPDGEQENDCVVKCLETTEYILLQWNKSKIIKSTNSKSMKTMN